MNLMRILTALYIVQVHDNKPSDKRGRGFFTAYRMNPYNPLSYIFIVISLVVGLVLYGIIGTFKGYRNPFKWD